LKLKEEEASEMSDTFYDDSVKQSDVDDVDDVFHVVVVVDEARIEIHGPAGERECAAEERRSRDFAAEATNGGWEMPVAAHTMGEANLWRTFSSSSNRRKINSLLRKEASDA